MKIYTLNEYVSVNKPEYIDTTKLNKPRFKSGINFFDPTTLDIIITLIENGELFHENMDMNIPITRETIFLLFPEMDQNTLDKIENIMKQRNITWKYPTYKDAVKTGKWSIDEFDL